MGGGAWGLGSVFYMNLCRRFPGYGGPKTFYGIEKILPPCRYMACQNWPLRARFWEFDHVFIGNFPKIGLRNNLFFLSRPPVLDLETWFSGYG